MKDLTDEMIDDACRCESRVGCFECKIYLRSRESNQDCIELLAAALKAEKAKPEDYIWKDAPEWAKYETSWFHDGEGRQSEVCTHVRDLPKSRARIIAEEKAMEFIRCECANGIQLSDVIEAAIKEALQEVRE